MEQGNNLKRLAARFDKNQFRQLHEEMTFSTYLDMVYANPLLIRTAYQRIYDMIMSKGIHTFERYRKSLTHYNFFDDEEIPIFGLEEALDNLVEFIRGAAGGYGTEKRVLLLHGPVGSSKSTICRRLKRGLEEYSRSPGGAWYTFRWINLPTGADGIYTHEYDDCPMHEEPLKLIPTHIRQKVIGELNDILRDGTPEVNRNSIYTLQCESELDPRCKKFMGELMKRNGGDWEAVVNNHIQVFRQISSEADRMGIATFQPKDEKNQDATELTGDIDYSRLPHYGRDSDPRAFSFDGEFCVGNRGLVEFIEMLKLAQEFLYDLLGASQERQIKPKKFAQISIDEAIIGHTNQPELVKLEANQYMEALKDRTVKIGVGYLVCLSDEIKVLLHDYGPDKVRQHVAPHTIEVAALFSILSRLEDDKDGKLDLLKKAKLYNGEMLPGYTEDSVKELHDKHPDEGMSRGVSARYVQDKISNCLSANHEYINPFMVMNEIREGLDNHPLINKKDDLARYHTCVDLAIKELDEILKDEVRKALTGDENAIIRLCTNYIDNLMAYIKKSKIRNKITGRDEPPNEKLMRSIEEKIDVPDQGVDDFRRMIAAFMGECQHEGKTFKWDSNTELKKALEAKLFEDTRDHIKLSALNVSGVSVVDPDLQEKIDAIKTRLIKQYGYIDKSASDVLEYCGSLFARGDLAKDE
jgi:serine protein kinase